MGCRPWRIGRWQSRGGRRRYCSDTSGPGINGLGAHEEARGAIDRYNSDGDVVGCTVC